MMQVGEADDALGARSWGLHLPLYRSRRRVIRDSLRRFHEQHRQEGGGKGASYI